MHIDFDLDADDYQPSLFKNATSIKFTRSQKTPLKFRDDFLIEHENLISVDFTEVTNIVEIGNNFIAGCYMLQVVKFPQLPYISHINNGFLANCKSLQSLNLSSFSHVEYIGDAFLACCLKLKSVIWFDLSKIKRIGDNFLYHSEFTSLNFSQLTQVTHIGMFFLKSCVELTSLIFPQSCFVTTIEINFLSDCKNIKSVDLSGFQNVTHVNCGFLAGCLSLTEINLSGFSNVVSIGPYFLYECFNLRKINLSCFSNVENIDLFFMYSCASIEQLDLSYLTKIKSINSFFLIHCSGLKIIFVNDNVLLKKHVMNVQLNSDIVIKTKYHEDFGVYDWDVEKIQRNKQFTKKLLTWLGMNNDGKHQVLVKRLKDEKNKFNEKYTQKEIKSKCVNHEDVFSLENLWNIPKGRLVMLDGFDKKSFCFDIIALQNFIFQQENLEKFEFKNPYTNEHLSPKDIDVILSANISKINYFCL